MAGADDHNNALSSSPYVPLIEALGMLESGQADCLTNNAIDQMIEQWGGRPDRFPGDIQDSRKNFLARAIRRLLRRTRWWHVGKPYRRLEKLPRDMRAAIRALRHRHRLPFPELYRE